MSESKLRTRSADFGISVAKKLIFAYIPIVILPYLTLFALATVFFSTKISLFNWIMEYVFCGNALYLIASFLIYCILACALSIVCFFVSVNEKWNPLVLAKTAMIMKLAQIPAYALIFAMGAICFVSIFTFVISVFLFLIDCLSVFMTGLLVISSVITTVRDQTFKWKDVVWVIPLQFVFCADVIASVAFNMKLNRINDQNNQ